ncbi:diguanylate cyclase (GGDEF)-like protein [Kineococcus xinjiangensis]|uniref:Diguanylate cyclase (GGDEF)-like protein n=1 Tax=Kineococcus xinjiangensis TaxID=512762 RepID=A0A2S6IDM0_9ACTN|nr:EAL domain-containing protein [Kineococcus xinjiangensis]PPK92299.1 diguanylate cyclase (GGDEF)-like protein [Kineococcus xinjiangensis]
MATPAAGPRARTAAWAAAFVLAALVGRATRLEMPPFAFVWPAAGVGILWLLLAPRSRRYRVELPVLAVAAFLVNLVTGAPPALALAFMLANSVNAVVGAAVLQRLSPRSPYALRDTRGLVVLGVAALAGAAASAPVSVAVTLLDDASRTASMAVLWVLRYGTSSGVVMGLVLAWRARLEERRRGEQVPGPRLREAAGVLAVSLAVHAAVFSQRPEYAFAFLVLPAIVLVGWRLGPAWTAAHGALTAAFAVAATMVGRGPFAGLESLPLRTAVVQAFIGVTGLVGLALSIEVRQRHAALRDSQRRGDALERTLQSAVVGNALLHLDPGRRGRVHYANPALRRWWGDEEGRVLQGWSWLDVLDPADRAAFERVLDDLAEGRATAWDGELRHRTLDGEERFCRAAAARLDLPATEGGRAEEPLANLQLVDITERKALEARLVHQALHDQLTGLPNRLLLAERLEQGLASLPRTGRTLALIFFDLDHFKRINDSLGHAAGDEVLSTVAVRLTAGVRPNDTVARIGGDEFVVCCPDIDVAEHVSVVAARLLAAVRRPVTVAGREVEVGISAGITLARPGATAADLLRESDTAMYEAKSAGRGRFEFFTESLFDRARRGLELEGELRRAVAAGQFVLHYQPIVDLASGRVLAAEALVRWEHPSRGLLLPGEWLEVAENCGLMPQLGALLLRDAVRQWPQLAAVHGPEVSVHVNVSASQLRDDGILDTITEALRESGTPAEHVVLELTETQLLTVRESLVANLDSIRDLGVRLAVDDFGTGYSSLTQLTSLPIDEVKIDRRFVAAMGTEPRSRAVVHAVIAMAREMGLPVVAEGVETQETAELLARAGCPAAQGFLWGRPGQVIDLRSAPVPEGASRASR